jgi:hypothetical protein
MVFKKNVISRKMQTSFKNPRILLFAGSLDVENDSDMDLFLYENIKTKNSVFSSFLERTQVSPIADKPDLEIST